MCHGDRRSVGPARSLRRAPVLALAAAFILLAGQLGFAQLLPQINDTVHQFGNLNTAIPQVFPPLSAVIAGPVAARPAGGVYSWRNDWSDWYHLQTDFTQIGFRVIRESEHWNDPISDEEFTNMANFSAARDATVMFTITGDTRDHFGAYGVVANDNAFFAAYNALIDSVLNRLGPGGTFWSSHPSVPYRPVMAIELWNEPNDESWFVGAYGALGPGKQGVADLYARCIMSAYAHVRSKPAWNAVKVVAGGVSRGGIIEGIPQLSWEERVHQRIVANGGNPAQCYDVWSNHPYVHDGPPDTEHILPSYHYSIVNTTAEIRRVMDQYGNQAKPIWFTEIGWHRSNGQYPESAQPFHNTERQQAAYVIRLFLVALRMGVEQVHVMMDTDADNFNGGFVNPWNGHSWYESATAAQKFLAKFPKPKLLGAISDGANGYYAYRIQPDADNPGSGEIIAAWNVQQPMTVTIPCSAGTYTISDMLGNTASYNATTGITTQIGPYPIFIDGDAVVSPPSHLRLKS